MPNHDHATPEEILNIVMGRLSELQATDLIHDIESTIARGVVVEEQPSAAHVFRPMNDEEKLSIALEYIVSAFDVPLMLARCREILGCDQIAWSIDSDEPQIVSGSIPPSDGRQNDILVTLLQIMDELQLPIPEVA